MILNKLSLGLAYFYVIIIFIKADLQFDFKNLLLDLLGYLFFIIWVLGPVFISSLYVCKASNYTAKRFFMAVQIFGSVLSVYTYYYDADKFVALAVPFVQYMTLLLLGIISTIIVIITKIANRYKKNFHEIK